MVVSPSVIEYRLPLLPEAYDLKLSNVCNLAEAPLIPASLSADHSGLVLSLRCYLVDIA